MPTLFLLMVIAYGFGGLVALAGGRGSVGRGLVALGAVVGAGSGLALGVVVLATGTPFVLAIPQLLPIAGGLALRLDPLGAFFLSLIGLGAIPAAIYGAGYSAAYEDGRASLRTLGVMFNLFLLTMSLVTLADNILTFLLMWEGMSLTSYFLVITESNEEGSVRAGLWYIAMTHAGLVMLVSAFVLMMNGGSGAFADLRVTAASLSPAIRGTVFALAFLGFGSKSGIVPLHIWLPMAHPAAPSHVSALMSGVMIKMGVYGILRVGLNLLGGGPGWWGALILVVGAASAILGILYALMEDDLKRLLAYSSVENVGLIFIGVGAGFLFLSRSMPEAAALAFIAAFYHALNHAAFKSLLFMGAGSVLHATHTRDMNLMGGLIKRLPWTAFFFLVGSVAIAGLPPLNGFVSEWLLFQSLLPGVSVSQPVVAAVMTAAIGLVALTGGLAAAGFVKAFGITFLAVPRSDAASRAHEAPLSMWAGMGLLTLANIGLGLAPFTVLPTLGRLVAGLGILPPDAASLTRNVSVQTPSGFAQISPTLVALGVLVVIVIVPLGLRIAGVGRRLRLSDSWGCGRLGQTPRMEYTSTAFAEPLRRVFAELYRPTKELTIDFHPESKYFVQSIEFNSKIRSWSEEFLYEPVLAQVRRLSVKARSVQSGSPHKYLAYIFIVLILMLCTLLWPGE
jgi:hydrogenase-4 component B